MKTHRVLVTVVLLSIASACTSGEEDGLPENGVTVVDSAGVELVRSRAPSDHRWRLSERPVVDVGTADGPEATLFFEPTGAVLLDDGSVIVANTGALVLAVHDREGARMREIAAIHSERVHLLMIPPPVVDRQPFSPSASLTAGSGLVLVAAGRTAEVVERDQEGRIVRRIRWPLEPERVTPQLVERWGSWYLARDLEHVTRDQRQQWLEDVEFPERLPVTGDLLRAPDGSLWVERYHTPWAEAADWDVFGADGGWMSTVEIPVGLDLHAVGRDRVAGFARDSLGVRHLRVYRLET